MQNAFSESFNVDAGVAYAVACDTDPRPKRAGGLFSEDHYNVVCVFSGVRKRPRDLKLLTVNLPKAISPETPAMGKWSIFPGSLYEKLPFRKIRSNGEIQTPRDSGPSSDPAPAGRLLPQGEGQTR